MTASTFDRQCREPNHTRLTYHGAGSGLSKIYNELVTCPNITELSLRFHWGGCVAPSNSWHFDFREGDKFPALKKLSLIDYDLLERQEWLTDNARWRYSWQYWAQSWLGMIVPSMTPHKELPEREPSLDKWLRAMDFSQIEELHLQQWEKVF